MSSSPTGFDAGRFLGDGSRLAAAIGAPWHSERVRRTVEVFEERFHTEPTEWKTHSRPGDHLYYRFIDRKRRDNVETALRSELIGESASTRFLRSWYERFGPAATASCDFRGDGALAKTWIFLGRSKPVEEVLDHRTVPNRLRAKVHVLKEAGMTEVFFVALDHVQGSVNLYFKDRGTVPLERPMEVLTNLGFSVPGAATVGAIRATEPNVGFPISITFSLEREKPVRACVYSLGIPEDRIPAVPERISRFLAAAPCYSADTCVAVAWSIGAGDNAYLKAGKAYTGDMIGYMTEPLLPVNGAA
ncbi:aromatic prenyltransferase [Amycolatopsis japonica]|uniref:aromatic prenyltransferase n=1 Tax=Amycolatopsis japonica TaxID=208439 RepID=UPI00366E840F